MVQASFCVTALFLSFPLAFLGLFNAVVAWSFFSRIEVSDGEVMAALFPVVRA